MIYFVRSLLKKKKTPFVIALNKIDRLYEWKSNRHKDVEDVVKSQSQNTQIEFQKRAQEGNYSILTLSIYSNKNWLNYPQTFGEDHILVDTVNLK